MDVLSNKHAVGGIEGFAYIQQKVKNEGYKLGQPWANDTTIAPYGLYKPLEKPAQSSKQV